MKLNFIKNMMLCNAYGFIMHFKYVMALKHEVEI